MLNDHSAGAIIVGAGRGRRLGADVNKCLISIEDIPMILITANAFQLNRGIEAIVLVVPVAAVNEIRDRTKSLGMDTLCTVVAGGERRQDSAQNGLSAIPKGIDKVLIHDGARALISGELIDRVISGLVSHPVVIPGVKVTDTLHKEDAGFAVEGAERAGIIAAQTPQGFKKSLLQECFELSTKNSYTVTDEATLVRDMSGVKPAVVEGDSRNVKITYPQDLEVYMPHLIRIAQELKGAKAGFPLSRE